MIAMKPSLEFGAVPKLVLSELLRRWVALHTGMELSLARTEEVEALAREPLPRGAASKAVTVCQRYDVVRVKKHLRLRLRTYASATS